MTSLFGTPGGFEQISTQTGQQQDLFSQLIAHLGGAQGAGLDWLTQILSGDEEAFGKFEAPFKRQFEQETIPSIAERFAGLGSHGSQSSSAMQQTLGQSGRELTENLAALRGNLQQNALSQLQGLMGQGFQQTFENVYRQPTQGIVGGALAGIGQGAGLYMGMQGLKGMGIG